MLTAELCWAPPNGWEFIRYSEQQRGKYDEARRANIDNLEKDLSRFLEDLKGGFQPLQMNLEVGAGSDIDGNLLQPSNFEMTLANDEFDENRRQWVKAGPSSGGDEPVSGSDDILDLLIQGQVTQNFLSYPLGETMGPSGNVRKRVFLVSTLPPTIRSSRTQCLF